MKIRFLLLLPKLAMTLILSGCLSTGYKLICEARKGESTSRVGFVELSSSSAGISFGKDYRHGTSLYAVGIGFSNVASDGDSLKITGINASVEDLDHRNLTYSLSNVYWNKFVKPGVGDRLVFIDSVVKNPVPFIVPYSPSKSIEIGNYYDYDHYNYAFAFMSESKRKRLRKAKVNVTVNYEWKGKSEMATRSLLFKRYHYFYMN